MNKTFGKNTPQEVIQWVKDRCGSKVATHSPKKYKRYSTSKASCCWGNIPNQGSENYLIATCTPSPATRDSPSVFFFDYQPR